MLFFNELESNRTETSKEWAKLSLEEQSRWDGVIVPAAQTPNWIQLPALPVINWQLSPCVSLALVFSVKRESNNEIRR